MWTNIQITVKSVIQFLLLDNILNPKANKTSNELHA